MVCPLISFAFYQDYVILKSPKKQNSQIKGFCRTTIFQGVAIGNMNYIRPLVL